jgi:hypothetical protein
LTLCRAQINILGFVFLYNENFFRPNWIRN